MMFGRRLTAILVCLILFPAGRCLAISEVANLRTGTLTANVNVRRAPGMEGRIITGLPAGSRISVTGEEGGWLQILHDTGSFSLQGWVFGDYVDLAEAASKTPEKAGGPDRETIRPSGAGTGDAASEGDPPGGGPPPPPAPESRPDPHPESRPVLSSADPVPVREAIAAEEKLYPVSADSASGSAAGRVLSVFRILLPLCSIVLSCMALFWAARSMRMARESCEKVGGLLKPGKETAGTGNRVAEKRRHPRIHRMVEVDFVVGERAYGGFIHNISKGGAFVETRERFDTGVPIRLSFPYPNEAGHVRMGGRIVRCSSEGIGVQFDSRLQPPGE